MFLSSPAPSPTSTSHGATPATDIIQTLGKLQRHHASLLRSLGWRQVIKHLPHPSNYSSTIHNLPHPMGPYLSRLARLGIPAPSSATPWRESRLSTVLRRGPHTSALHQFKSFLFEDLLDMVSKGYWAILPYNAVRHLPHLKLSPAGVVPQRTHRPRPIMDYSFTGVNEASLQLAPRHAMQLGHALPRLLQRIAYANHRHGPPLLMKLNLSDSYYRVRLSP